jgi:hypothetical protein
MSEPIDNLDTSYPFLREWLAQQAEPLEESGIDWNVRSPLTKERLTERKQGTLFERKESEPSTRK